MAGRRGNGEGCIRQKQNGYWEAIITIGYDSKGKQLSKYFTAKTRAEVATRMNDYIVEVRKGTYIEPSKQTLAEWLDYWYENHVVDKVKVKTRCDYESSIRCYIKPHLGGIKLTELKGMQVQKFYNYLLEKGSLRKKGGLSPKTVRNIHVALRMAMEQAVKDDFIAKNPLNAVTLPKQNKVPPKALTPEEQKNLEKQCSEHPWGMVILLTLYTGMRLGEVTGLTWDSIDFEKNLITINKQLGRIQNFEDDAEQKTSLCLRYETKTSSSNRIIAVSSVIMAKLKEYKETQDMHRVKFKAVYNDQNMVFCREDGNYIDPKTFNEFFHKMLTKAGIEIKGFHSLRHTFITRALELGIDPKITASIVGHSSIQMTLDTYSHVSKDLQHSTMQKITDSLYT